LRRIPFALPLLLISLSPTFTAAQHARLLVAEKGQQSLAIIDPVSGKVLASVPEGGVTGHEVIASPDGRLAFVPIYGNSGVGKPGTDGRTSTQQLSAPIIIRSCVTSHWPASMPRPGEVFS